MNRWLLTLSLLIGSFYPSLHAQDTLTFAQVYDYAVGDVFQAKGEVEENETYETYTVLERYLSPAGDTLRYQLRVDYAIYTSEPPFTEFDIDTQELRILNPERAAVQGNRTACIPTQDTGFVSTEFCGRRVWQEAPQEVAPDCPNFVEHTTSLIEGLGGPYYTSESVERQNWAYPYFQYELIYFKKGNEVCGDFFNSLQQLPASYISLYPNPASGRFFLHLSYSDDAEVTLFDLQGKEKRVQVVDGAEKSIEVQTNFVGIGLVRVQTRHGVWWGRVRLD